MHKKVDKEKALLKDILEEEELLLDNKSGKKSQRIVPPKTIPPAPKNLLEERVQNVEKRPPKKRTLRESDILPYRSKDNDSHIEDLQNVFDNYPRVHRNRLIKISVLVVCVIAITLFVASQIDFEQVENIEKANVIVVPVREDVSYRSIHNMSGTTRILGFLKYSTVRMGSSTLHVFSAVDDFGSEITLTGIDNRDAMKFIPGNTTQQLYEIEGTMSVGRRGPELKVSSIKPGTRPIH
jgi:hypothetical protein